MGKSSIAAAAEKSQPVEIGPKLKALHLKQVIFIGGSQPSMIADKEPWSIRFDWEKRIVVITCARDGFSDTGWTPFENIQFVSYEREKDGPLSEPA